MLNPLSPKTQPEIIESLADVLSDPQSFDFKVEELRTFFIYLEISKESGTPMAKAPRDQFQNLSKSLASVTLDVISPHSAGIAVSDANNHMYLRSTSPNIARWNLLNAQSAYHPLVVRSNSASGAIQRFAKRMYGGSLDRCKSGFDLYARIDTSLLQIWCHIFDHWLGANMVEILYSPDITNLEDSSTRPKRKRGAPKDSKDSKANSPKKVKQEIKKQENAEIMICEPDIPRFQIPPYPAGWPAPIITRLKKIPPFKPPPLSEDFMNKVFKRREFSAMFGSSWVKYDSTWKRKERAVELMDGLGQTYIIGAVPLYNFLPHAPCAPGILLNDPNTDMPNGDLQPRTVFVRVREKPSAWLYVGEYYTRLSEEPLSLDEWRLLTDKQRASHYKNDDAWDDLNEGRANLRVYTMECFAYHEGIQRAICTLPSSSL